MAGWILVIGADSRENWALGRGAGIWATKKSHPFRKDDLLFFWQAGGAGLIANAVALSDSVPSRDYDYDTLPWPDRWDDSEEPPREVYKSIVEMRVLQETAPLAMSWSAVASTLGFKGGANTAPVQFGEGSAELAASWFRPDVAHPKLTVEFGSRTARVHRAKPDEDADDPFDDVVVAVLSPPRTIDPEVVGEARNRHNRVVRAIHQLLRDRGKRPIKPTGWFGEQPDVVWREDPGFHIVEVKGITGLNEREQLRLGLGQVLRYRFISEKQGHPPQAWLITDVAPADLTWIEICDSLNIRMWWPGRDSRGPGAS